MVDSATRQAWLDALEAAYYRGIRSVTHGDTTTTYQDMASMRLAIIEARAMIARRPIGYIYQSGKGL